MWEAFSNDESGYKKKIYAYIFVILLAFAGAYILNNMQAAQTAENMKLAATYDSESAWLRRIDYEEMDALYKAILKPVAADELEAAQQQQLDIFRKHNLTIDSVRNSGDKSGKKSKIKFATTKVTVSGTWENLAAALNEFETKNLVVITLLDMASDNKTGLVEAKLDYNICYQ